MNYKGSAMQFAHEKLMVYHKILAFIGSAEDWLREWNRKHAFVDHLSRASESILSNPVQAVRLRSGPSKQRSVDYSVGSTMECGACMKGLLNTEEAGCHKSRLVEIVKMLIGLRKSFLSPRQCLCILSGSLHARIMMSSFRPGRSARADRTKFRK